MTPPNLPVHVVFDGTCSEFVSQFLVWRIQLAGDLFDRSTRRKKIDAPRSLTPPRKDIGYFYFAAEFRFCFRRAYVTDTTASLLPIAFGIVLSAVSRESNRTSAWKKRVRDFLSRSRTRAMSRRRGVTRCTRACERIWNCRVVEVRRAKKEVERRWNATSECAARPTSLYLLYYRLLLLIETRFALGPVKASCFLPFSSESFLYLSETEVRII